MLTNDISSLLLLRLLNMGVLKVYDYTYAESDFTLSKKRGDSIKRNVLHRTHILQFVNNDLVLDTIFLLHYIVY